MGKADSVTLYGLLYDPEATFLSYFTVYSLT